MNNSFSLLKYVVDGLEVNMYLDSRINTNQAKEVGYRFIKDIVQIEDNAKQAESKEPPECKDKICLLPDSIPTGQ